MAKKSACEKVESVLDFNKHPEKIKVIEPKFQWTTNQIEFIKRALCKDTKIIILDGPAGSGKTTLSAYCGLRLIQDQHLEEIIYIRSAVESAVSSKIGQIGTLPGDLAEKFQVPYGQVFIEHLRKYLSPGDFDIVSTYNQYRIIPPNYLRGETFENCLVIVDEVSNFDWHTIELIITRLGENAKIIFMGDSNQCDLPKFIHSGFGRLKEIFSDGESKEKGVYTITFGKEDIKRSGILRFIVEKIEAYRARKSKLQFDL